MTHTPSTNDCVEYGYGMSREQILDVIKVLFKIRLKGFQVLYYGKDKNTNNDMFYISTYVDGVGSINIYKHITVTDYDDFINDVLHIQMRGIIDT